MTTTPAAAAEPTPEMDKRFDPASYEAAWMRRWSEAGLFDAVAAERPAFCLMIPPPNVTGKLHMGHALQSTLQDILTRWQRMLGKRSLWLPGTDHAGIATQLMVERQVASEGTSRVELGRERFLERTWEWKRKYHGNIRRQLDLLGASCDWSRERFTLDEGLSRAVREAFVRLHREGLITRGEYMVNWSPVLETAVSDLEVETKTVQGKLYHIAYAVEGGDLESGERIVVATTRPETMLGDTAVALHPEDERYRHLHGRAAILPLVGRRLPFVADEMVDREFGTGLVKITPFHDPNDFEVAKRQGLPGVAVIDKRGRMTAEAGPDFEGLTREEARAKVVERLAAEGHLVRVEDHVHNVGHSQRSGEAIEPLVSTQWFCDVSGMAKQALDAVRDGRLELVPATWEKTWEHWLENIRPWCISRQLWWGHQIPAWYTEDGRTIVAHDVLEAAARAGVPAATLTQDPDVLDTWFSSGLWPFSTLGWPDETADLKAFYPTDVLITGFDILFFWVARMAMLGLHLTGDVPFRRVHLTGLVRDAEGVKMSKTKGNVLDPEELIQEFGADAVRFTLAALDSPGRDIPLNPEQMAGYRAFGNKIWNAARFALSRVPAAARVRQSFDAATFRELAAPERWILSRLTDTAQEVDTQLGLFRFDEACHRLYHFFWGELCDWYIELAKPALMDAASARPHVGDVLLTVLDRALRLLHPFMPFLTEEVWQRLPGRDAGASSSICTAGYPQAEPAWRDAAVEADLDALIEVATRVRSLLTESGRERKVGLWTPDPAREAFLDRQRALLATLCRLESLEVRPAAWPAHEGGPEDLIAGVGIKLLGEKKTAADSALNHDAEIARIDKELEKLATEIAKAEAQLADEGFLARAPAPVVDKRRASLAQMEERRAALAASLEGLGGGGRES